MSQKILVIGGVAVGPKSACRAKRLDPDADVIMVDQDNIISYGGCGIPYYVCGDVAEPEGLRQTAFHRVRDASFFAEEKCIKVKTSTRALKIDRRKQEVLVKNLENDQEEILSYDKLVLATGSTPFVPPIPGAEADGVSVVSNMHQAMDIKARLAKGEVGKAVILGAGAIGLEMGEAMADLWGAETTIVEMMDQILPRVVDPNIATMAEHHLEQNNITVYTSERAEEILTDDNGKVTGVKTDKRSIEADIVIMAVGVRPNSQLAAEAGLAIGPFGGIVVNQRMQTSDRNIYAGGDCVEQLCLVSGMSTYAPLGSVANRQGRVIGSNLVGKPETFEGVVGSFIIKLFNNCVAKTGLSLEMATFMGYDAIVAFIAQADKAHFYPDNEMIYMQMVVEKKTKRVLGVQGISSHTRSLLARISAVAAILKYKPTVEDISNMEIPYSPPYASAMDVINTLGNAAQNLLEGRNKPVYMEDFMQLFADRENEKVMFLDVRGELQAEPLVEKYGPHWVNIPNNELGRRIDELPDDKKIILICNAGSRSYDALNILQKSGKDVHNLLGGMNGLLRAGYKF